MTDDTLTKNELYYGSKEALPEQRALRAGPLTMLYENGDLRHIKLGKQEILRRVYVAIRDHNWNTIKPTLANVRMDIGADRFLISFDVDNHERDIHFRWHGEIRGETSGALTLSMDGAAQTTFQRNRIGFCILHPMDCAGRRCRVEKVDGSVQENAFPLHISPHQPFMDIRAISHEVTPGVWAAVRMTGDTFEMEDQRNWTDASYKTYSTPLALPFPVEIAAGTRVAQQVSLTLRGKLPRRAAKRAQSPTVTIGARPAIPLPRLGLGLASHGEPLSAREVARLKALRLAHLRVDLALGSGRCTAALRRAASESETLGVPLEVALLLGTDTPKEMAELKEALRAVSPLPVCAWLALMRQRGPLTPAQARAARETIAPYAQGAPIGGGTNAYFTELNRDRPPVELLDLISYSLNPQVHAFDNLSLVETLPAQAVTASSARQFSGGRPLAISPITLRPRFNPHATGADAPPLPGELPSAVDARQMSLLGAAWTVGSLKYIAASRLYSATYYETTGWRGVMEQEGGSPIPETFRSLPGAVFPLYHILADAGEFAGGKALPTRASDPLRVEGLALQQGQRRRALLANLTAEPQMATVRGLGDAVWARLLDEGNVIQAMTAPEEFRAERGERLSCKEGELQIELPPYAIARLDS
jgi:hypothetical protein